MLLFICAGIAGGNARIEFQYIPCYSLSGVRLYRSGQNQVSIHPMLLFIYSHCSWHAHEHGVSIHPMLLFIRYSQYKVWSENRVSIHPMLLFISGLECSSDRYYFVSIHPMLLFIWRDILRWLWTYGSFNTSHVTLYQKADILESLKEQRFNTSHVTLYPEEELLRSRQVHVSIHPMLLFIYASNFNLAAQTRFNTSHVTLYQIIVFKTFVNDLRFNTSHVTLYLSSVPVRNLSVLCFNTSHVTLYLEAIMPAIPPVVVSIHPMLLFIPV